MSDVIDKTLDGAFQTAEAEDLFAYEKCQVIVSEQVCIQANVKIYPKVTIGEIMTFCGEPTIGKCGRVNCGHEPCDFTVSETICIQIPLTFSAEAKVDPAGYICGTPEAEPCPHCNS